MKIPPPRRSDSRSVRESPWPTPRPQPATPLIVGAGIVGLATAREALLRRPGSQVVVLERGPAIAGGQTANNSGVIHAGVYYAPGSRKARLCVDGARRLYELCDELGVPAERCGKLIVARSAARAAAARRARAPRRGQRRDACAASRGAEIADVEPHARGVAALHVPDTGIVDFGARGVARCWPTCRPAAARSSRAARSTPSRTGWCATPAASPAPRTVVVCAGLDAARLAQRSGEPADPRIVPFRGAYLRLRRPELVRALIYPVPDPALPFLGVHLTRRIQGDVVAGPTALPALTGPARHAHAGPAPGGWRGAGGATRCARSATRCRARRTPVRSARSCRR